MVTIEEIVCCRQRFMPIQVVILTVIIIIILFVFISMSACISVKRSINFKNNRQISNEFPDRIIGRFKSIIGILTFWTKAISRNQASAWVKILIRSLQLYPVPDQDRLGYMEQLPGQLDNQIHSDLKFNAKVKM